MSNRELEFKGEGPVTNIKEGVLVRETLFKVRRLVQISAAGKDKRSSDRALGYTGVWRWRSEEGKSKEMEECPLGTKRRPPCRTAYVEEHYVP